MSDSVKIILVIAICIVLVLFMFRRQLKDFFIKASKDGIEARLRTQKTTTPSRAKINTGQVHKINISGNKQFGKGNVIDLGVDDANVTENEQIGLDQEIRANSSSNTSKRK